MSFRPLVLACLALVASTATAGVDHGNPKTSFFNMEGGYRLLDSSAWNITLAPDAATVRIDTDLHLRKLGFFVVTKRPYTPPSGWQVCSSHAVAGATQALWIGRDCRHPQFIKRFETLTSSLSTQGVAK